MASRICSDAVDPFSSAISFKRRYSSYFGGSGTDELTSVGLAPNGIIVAGPSNSSDFPTEIILTGVALRGVEVTADEPQRLVVAIRDTRGNSRGEAQLYPNLFINNTGLTPAGVGTTDAVTVEVSAISNSSGLAVGVPLTVTIPAGHTVAIGKAMNALKIPAGSEEAVLIYARVVSGDAAIHGIVSQVDATTRDGSVLEMSRADF